VRQLLRFAAPVRDVSVMLSAVKNQVVEVLSQVCDPPPLCRVERYAVICLVRTHRTIRGSARGDM
jgi:hypothetical protein